MWSLEMTSLNLECGCGCCSSAVSNDGTDESIYFSKATEGSCFPEAADSSNHGHNSDSDNGQVLHSRRASSVAGSDCIVNIDNGVDEVRISIGTMERECRICMLSLDSESGIALELGCSCKNELAAVHQHCAEQWFKSKGNKICEICKSVAQNVVVPNDIESRQHIYERFLTNAVSMSVFERNTFSTNAVSVPVFELDTFSSNAVSPPVSSTSESMPCFIFKICMVVGCFFFFIFFFTLDMININNGNATRG